jgi:hypothetical protein
MRVSRPGRRAPGWLSKNLPAQVRPTDQLLPPPSEYGDQGEEVLNFLWRVLHLDGYDILPLDAHFRARGGDAAFASALAKARSIARERGVERSWVTAADDARAALAWNATSRQARVASFGNYLSEVAGAVASRGVLEPELFESLAFVWLDLAEPWGHVAEQMPTLLARIDALTIEDAWALAATDTRPNFATAGVNAHLAGRDFLFNSAFWTAQWRAWRAAARANGRAEAPFRQADYSEPWPSAVMLAAAVVVALGCGPVIAQATADELARPWREVIGPALQASTAEDQPRLWDQP